MRGDSIGEGSVVDSGKPTVSVAPMLIAAGVCALLTVPVAWLTRRYIGNDGLSYLEMAEATLQHGLGALVTNGSWSPGYPALLAVVLALIHPARISELAVLRAVDWTICTATYLCFTYFLANLLKAIHSACGTVFVASRGYFGLLALAYGFVFASKLDISLWLAGPNVMLEGVTYLIAGVCIRLSLPNARWIHQASLGALLALGYAIKAIMFPLSLVLLALYLVWPASNRQGRKRTLIAGGVFVVLSAPLVAGLSLSRGHLTFSEIGNINVAWYVNDLPRYWDCGPASFAGVTHAPKLLATNPAVLKFEGPSDLTYPYWYDPALWYEGVKGHYNPVEMLRQVIRFLGLVRNPRIYSAGIPRLSERWFPLYAGLAWFAILGLRPGGLWKAMQGQVRLLLWLAVGILAFAAVHVEYRYLVPYVVPGFIVVFVAATAVTGLDRSRWVNWTVGCSLIVVFALFFARNLMHDRRIPPWAQVAGKLTALGIGPGDELAAVGFADFSYDARLVGARFTIEIPNKAEPSTFADLPAEDVNRTLAVLKANGVKAVFSAWRPAFNNDSGWVPIGQRDYVRMIK